MARIKQGIALVLLIVACICTANAQGVDAFGGVFNGGKAIDGSSTNQGKVLNAAVDLLTSKLNLTMSGLQAKLKPALKAAGMVKTDLLPSLLAPLQGTAVKTLNTLTAVREAADVSLNSFFGLLLDNTKELRKTLQDGDAILEIVRTLRGAKCDAAKFEPPLQKPATIAGPAGSLKITTGSCSLKRSADPLRVDYTLECVEPGAAFLAQVPRYTSRFVTAAKATTEECKVVRKYGVESETVVTLFNPADFFAAAAESGGTATAGASASSTGADGDLGVNPAAGWFSTMFPVASSLKKGKRVQFMPKGVLEAVQKAIKESTIDLTLEYKPFTIKQDMIKSASAAAEALSQVFEVQQKVFKVYKDDLADWADPEKRSEIMRDLSFKDNLRDAMGKYNITALFDGAFAKTASRLMSKTRLGSKLASKLPGGGGLSEQLTTEKPLRTLLAQARAGAGQPVSIKIEAGLNQAVTKALDALKGAGAGAAGGAGAWGQLLGGKPRKGSLMELLLKDKGTRGHLQELGQLFDNMGGLTAQLGVLRQATDAKAGADQQQQQPEGAQMADASTAAGAGAGADAGATTTTAAGDAASDSQDAAAGGAADASSAQDADASNAQEAQDSGAAGANSQGAQDGSAAAASDAGATTGASP